MKKLQPKKRFFILGYSFGVMIALEMAAILEEHGKITTYLFTLRCIQNVKEFLHSDLAWILQL